MREEQQASRYAIAYVLDRYKLKYHGLTLADITDIFYIASRMEPMEPRLFVTIEPKNTKTPAAPKPRNRKKPQGAKT